jgi:capsular exopolysaccharide synthesis family protein
MALSGVFPRYYPGRTALCPDGSGPRLGTMRAHSSHTSAPARDLVVHRAAPSSASAPDATGAALDHHLASLLAPASFEADQYRLLRDRLDVLREEERLQVVALTSPTVGDGKTVTAINLAGTFAQSAEARVLLVDADVRRPAVGAYLGLGGRPTPGLVDVMLDPARSLADVARRHPRFNLWIVPAGQSPLPAWQVFKAPRLGELLDEARRTYDYIIVDTPPVLPVPDTRLVAGWVDGVLLVVAAHKTPRKLLEEALGVLEPEKVLGLIFNQDDRPLAGYYGRYGAYYARSASQPSGRAGWWQRALETLGRRGNGPRQPHR